MSPQKQGIFSGKVLPAIITIIIILIGTGFYFTSAKVTDMGGAKFLSEDAKNTEIAAINPDITFLINDVAVKAAYTSKGELKLFAYAPSSRLLKIKPLEGISAPSESVIIGYEESKIIRKGGLFRYAGDKIDNLFGINTEIGGILVKTGTIIDYVYFLDYHQFNELKGQENKVFFKINSDGAAKLFYDYNPKDPLNIELLEGDIKNYQVHTIGEQKYYPIILGYEEAKTMREEKLFDRTGDIIKGFFGKDVVIVGILKETDSVRDKIHLIPLNDGDLS